MSKIKLSGRETWPPKLKVLVSGDPGSGKTSFAASFPNPFFIMCNGGEATLSKFPATPFMEVDNENELFSITKVITELESPVETIVIDSIDDFQRRLMLDRLKNENRKETKIEDWGWLATRINAIVGHLSALPFHFVLTSRINTEQGRLAIQGQFGDQVLNYVDYSFRVQDIPDPEVYSVQEVGSEEIHLLDIPSKKFLTAFDSWCKTILPEAFIEPTFEALHARHEQERSELKDVSLEGTSIDNPVEAMGLLEKIYSTRS